MVATKVTCATAQGRRSEQQDRHAYARIDLGPLARGEFMAVMDGHGGRKAAEMTAKEIVPLLEEMLKKNGGQVLDSLRDLVSALVLRAKNETSGSSLSAVFVPDPGEHAYVAILGDSPVIIRGLNNQTFLGPLHNVRANEEERAAAIARGGLYIDGYLEDSAHPGEGLQLTRALGDCHLDRVLNRDPDIFQVDLGKSSFVLLATDGVFRSFDAGIDSQVRHLVDHVQRGADAQVLVQDALRRNTGDNVTAVLWRAIVN